MTELCIRCGKETPYLTTTPITARKYFIEGSGQLCEECWRYLWPSNTKEKRVRRQSGEEE